MDRTEIQVGDQVQGFRCDRCPEVVGDRPIFEVKELRREYTFTVVFMAIPGTHHYHTSTPTWAVEQRIVR